MRMSEKKYNFALITGATSGIGRAFAKVLPPSVNLFLTGRNEEQLKELATKLHRDGRIIVTLSGDLADLTFRNELAEKASQHPIDLFFNNAGVGVYGKFDKQDAGALSTTLGLNVAATSDLTYRLLPLLKRNKGAMIITSSVVGFIPTPYFAVYSASKAYNLFLAQALAEELKPKGVHVMALCPGATNTRFHKRAGIGESKTFNKGADAYGVAVGTYKALLKKKRVYIPGIGNKLFVFCVRFLPRTLLVQIAGRIIKSARNIAP